MLPCNMPSKSCLSVWDGSGQTHPGSKVAVSPRHSNVLRNLDGIHCHDLAPLINLLQELVNPATTMHLCGTRQEPMHVEFFERAWHTWSGAFSDINNGSKYPQQFLEDAR
jgi:hypothetical protein